MPSTTVIIKLAILIFSFIIGIVFFYMTNKGSRLEKKQRLDQLLSYTINFILFIWTGKIIIHIKIFFQDPFAVLAYPSDSRAVYIATVFLIMQMVYHKIRKNLDVTLLVSTFIPVYLASSFMYEFLQMIVMDSSHALFNLLLMAALVLFYILIQNKLSEKQIAIGVISVYSLSHLAFTITLGYTTVFGYMLHPLYFMSIFVLNIWFFLYDRQRRLRQL